MYGAEVKTPLGSERGQSHSPQALDSSWECGQMRRRQEDYNSGDSAPGAAAGPNVL